MLGGAGGGQSSHCPEVSLWDQPPVAHMATDAWLPPNTSFPNIPPGHTIRKVNKCNFFSFTNDTLHPLPAGVRVGNWLKVTVHKKGNNVYKMSTKERARAGRPRCHPGGGTRNWVGTACLLLLHPQ